jgi:hypothetical protein
MHRQFNQLMPHKRHTCNAIHHSEYGQSKAVLKETVTGIHMKARENEKVKWEKQGME